MRSGLCETTQLGSFITTLPEGRTLDSTTIYTTALKFSHGEGQIEEPEIEQTGEAGNDNDSLPNEDFDNVAAPPKEDPTPEPVEQKQPERTPEAGTTGPVPTVPSTVEIEGLSPADLGSGDGATLQRNRVASSRTKKTNHEERQDIDSIIEGIKESLAESDGAADIPGFSTLGTSIQGKTMAYTSPIVYDVLKTGYYCVGESTFMCLIGEECMCNLV